MIAYSTANTDTNYDSDSSGTADYIPNSVWIISDSENSGGTKIHYRDEEIYYTLISQPTQYDDFILSIRALNAKRSKLILRDGPRMVFKPKKQGPTKKLRIVYRIMRCNAREYHQNRRNNGE